MNKNQVVQTGGSLSYKTFKGNMKTLAFLPLCTHPQFCMEFQGLSNPLEVQSWSLGLQAPERVLPVDSPIDRLDYLGPGEMGFLL